MQRRIEGGGYERLFWKEGKKCKPPLPDKFLKTWTLHANMAMSDLQRYYRKLCLIKFSLDINNIVSLCSFSFGCSQREWISHFKSNRGKITEINTIQDRKTTLSCTFLIRLHCRMLMLGDNEMVYSVPARHAIISCNVFWQTSRGNLLHSLLLSYLWIKVTRVLL